MSETTTSASVVVDERARFRAFTALGVALTGLLGGGVFATAFQWMAMRAFNENGDDQFYWMGAAAGPLVMSLVALWLASTALNTDDPLAGPVARTTLVLSGVAVLGSALLMIALSSQM